MYEDIAKLKTIQGCEQYALNNEARSPDLAKAARRRAVELRAAEHGATTPIEHELLQAVYAYERVLSSNRGKNTRASRTWQMIDRHGIIKAAEAVVSRKADSAGYSSLLAMNMQDMAFEAVVLRHRESFAAEAVARAHERMREWTTGSQAESGAAPRGRGAQIPFEPLTDAELETIIRNISTEIGIEASYDYTKYPADVLAELRQTFADPAAVTFPVVEKALKWKYGHINKQNYPGHQRELARKIAELWPTTGIRPGTDPKEAFERWQSLLPTSYITVCFLLHLVDPDTMPILDQHNYRSVANHLTRAGRMVVAKPAPKDYGDLLLVRDFSAAVRSRWTKVIGEPAPDAGRLDRYLMMHGKALKK